MALNSSPEEKLAGIQNKNKELERQIREQLDGEAEKTNHLSRQLTTVTEDFDRFKANSKMEVFIEK